MNKKKKMIHDLRFPEFADKETWAEKRLSEVLVEHKERSSGTEEVYSVSVHKGVINQIEHLGRVFAASNTENYKRVLPGDIIYTKSPTGDFPFGIIKQSKVQKPVIVSPLYGVFTPETKDLGTILDAYFEYPEKTINYLSSIIQKGAKNTININNETFLSKCIILPIDRAEQRKIASCFSSLDEVILAHVQNLELLKNHKKGLMQNLFPQEEQDVPKVRFREFEREGSWKEKKLGDKTIAFFVNEKISIKNITGDTYVSTENMLPDFAGVSVISKVPLMGSFTKYKVGDILVSNIRPYLKKVWKADKNGAASNDVIVFRSGSDVHNDFLEFILKHESFINYVMQSAKGVKMPRGDKESMLNYTIFIPSKEEQKKIADCLSALDKLILAQSEKVRQLKEYKKGLVQGLFPKTES